MAKTSSVNQCQGLKLIPPYYLVESTPKKSKMWQPEPSTALGGYWTLLDPYPNPLRTALREIQENSGNSKNGINTSPPKSLFTGEIIPREELKNFKYIEVDDSMEFVPVQKPASAKSTLIE